MLSITSIEVIRANPGLALEAVYPEKVELTYGDSLRVNVRLDYKGPKLDATLYGAIGVRHPFPEYIPSTFGELVAGEATAHFTKSDAFAPWSGSVEIPITADIKPGTNYDIYCKIKEYPGAGMPEVDDVITITGIPPTFELLEETIYPYAYVYEGNCDIVTFTFKTDPFTPASWIAGKLARHFEKEARKSGLRVMEMRVYVDRSPLLWTDWRIEAVGTPAPATAGLGMSLGIPLWAAVLIIAFAIIAVIIVATLATKTIVGLFKRKPELEAVKVGWGKETLIKTIQDSEEYWERTPTPIETLEEMSETELRDYLDKIAEEEVAPPVEGLGLAIAAAAVLGLGALALVGMAIGKPKEAK